MNVNEITGERSITIEQTVILKATIPAPEGDPESSEWQETVSKKADEILHGLKASEGTLTWINTTVENELGETIFEV